MRSFNWNELNRRAADEYLQPVRPGVPGRSPFWNVASRQFTYVPAFDVPEEPEAARYRVQATDLATGKVYTALQEKPWSPVEELWRVLPRAAVRIEVFALDHRGKVLKRLDIGGAPSREFCRRPGFHGPYEAAVRTYRDCALLSLKRVFAFARMCRLIETGVADPAVYGYFCYPTLMLAALISGLVRYAAISPADHDEAMRIACAAADILIRMSAPEGGPLAFLPPTYQGDLFVAGGQNHVIQMSGAFGSIWACLEIYTATRDEPYRVAALRIADTCARLQLPDGSWYLKYDANTGTPATGNRLIPDVFFPLSFRLEALGMSRAAAMRSKAFAWLMEEVIAPFNWEGQFEDVAPTQHYRNLCHGSANFIACYLLEHRAENPAFQPLAETLLRFSEDQFILWGRCSVPEEKAGDFKPSIMEGWLLPLAQEQYGWMQGINASAAGFIRSWTAMYKATGDELWLAKACALGDTMTISQRPTGELPTYWSTNGELKDDNWINCEVWTATALLDLAEACGC